MMPWMIPDNAAALQTEAEAKVEPQVQSEAKEESELLTKPKPQTSPKSQTHQDPRARPNGAPLDPEPQLQADHEGLVPFSPRNTNHPFANGPPTSLTDSSYFPSTHRRYEDFYGGTDKSATSDSDSDSERRNRSRAPSPPTTRAETPASPPDSPASTI